MSTPKRLSRSFFFASAHAQAVGGSVLLTGFAVLHAHLTLIETLLLDGGVTLICFAIIGAIFATTNTAD
jgi:hypothetical protein